MSTIHKQDDEIESAIYPLDIDTRNEQFEGNYIGH